MDDEQYVMISAITHYGYCPRRCSLIHVEQIFEENVFTLRGQQNHERVDTAGYANVGEARTERALPIWCDRLGIYGKADAVEFHTDGSIVPVEYKSGAAPKGKAGANRASRGKGNTGMPPEVGAWQGNWAARASDLQLCAQAVCLEEMFGREVKRGAIYHVASRARRDVELSPELRHELEKVIAAIRDDLVSGIMPAPVNDARCPNCSLVDSCVPAALVSGRQAYHQRQLYIIGEENR
jgi:CRISPR-associated exonuclease Cas4